MLVGDLLQPTCKVQYGPTPSSTPHNEHRLECSVCTLSNKHKVSFRSKKEYQEKVLAPRKPPVLPRRRHHSCCLMIRG